MLVEPAHPPAAAAEHGVVERRGEDVLDQRVLGGEAAHGRQRRGVDPAAVEVQVIAQVHPFDDAPHDVVVEVADRDDPVDATFEVDGGIADPGAATTSEGALASPTASNSSTSGGELVGGAVHLVGLGQETRLVTNSPVSRMLVKVSLSSPVLRGCMVSDTIGGLRPTAVKKEMGARLATPSVETVLTHAIARGTMLPMSSL